MPGRRVGSGVGYYIAESPTEQQKVQLYYEDEPLCPSSYIIYLCVHQLAKGVYTNLDLDLFVGLFLSLFVPPEGGHHAVHPLLVHLPLNDLPDCWLAPPSPFPS